MPNAVLNLLNSGGTRIITSPTQQSSIVNNLLNQGGTTISRNTTSSGTNSTSSGNSSRSSRSSRSSKSNATTTLLESGGTKITPQSNSQTSQDLQRTLQRQNVSTARESLQRDQNYIIQTKKDNPEFLTDEYINQAGSKASIGFFGAIDKYITNPIKPAVSKLPFGIGQALYKKAPTPSLPALAFTTASAPFFETGGSTSKLLTASGFKGSSNVAFVSPMEKLGFQESINELGFSIASTTGRKVATSDTTDIISSLTARQSKTAEALTIQRIEVTPLSETTAEVFSRGSTRINLKGMSGTTFKTDLPTNSMARITDIEKASLTFQSGKNQVTLNDEIFSGNVEGISNLRAGAGGDRFKSFAISQSTKEADNIFTANINPRVNIGKGLKYQSERSIAVAGKDYAPMTIKSESTSGFSLDTSKLKLTGVGKIYKPIQSDIGSIKIQEGFKPISSNSNVQSEFLTTVNKNVNNLGLSIAPQSQARQLSTFSMKSSFGKVGSTLTPPQALEYAFKNQVLGTTTGLGFPKNTFNDFSGFKSIPKLSSSSGFSLDTASASRSSTIPKIDINTNLNTGSSSSLITDIVQTQGTDFGVPYIPITKTPQVSITSDPFTFTGTGFSFNNRLIGPPTTNIELGGFSIPNVRKRGKKNVYFDIFPSFSSVITGASNKDTLKVSKTFGVTPFQTRGLLKNKNKRYYKLTDI